MELVGKIFETLEITPLALLQMALVVVLAFVLSAVLIRPMLSVFEERENLRTKPLEESRRLLAEAEEKARSYSDAVHRASVDALGRRRSRLEEVSRAQRRRVEEAAEEANREVEALLRQIGEEKERAAAALRAEADVLSRRIAEKVLGRQVA